MRTAAPHKGRPCTVCAHANLKAIDRELLEPGASLTEIAARYPPLVRTSLGRHRTLHIASVLKAETVQAFDADQAAHGLDLTERVDKLFDRANDLLTAMQAEKDFRGATTAIREMRGCLELLGKLRGEIADSTTINVFASPTWVTVQTNVLAALAPYPEAKAAVVLALDVPGG